MTSILEHVCHQQNTVLENLRSFLIKLKKVSLASKYVDNLVVSDKKNWEEFDLLNKTVFFPWFFYFKLTL